MKSVRDRNQYSWFRQKTASFGLMSLITFVAIKPAPAANVVLWDTGVPLVQAADAQTRTQWKAVPSDIVALEADPQKAASDPGYYGREYSFHGDAVVENPTVTALFWSVQGRVMLYSKAAATLPGAVNHLGQKILEFVPLQMKTVPARISHCTVLRNADDEVAVEVTFSAKGAADASAVFIFDRTPIVEIRPAENMKGLSLTVPLDYGILPSFVGDDLIYGATGYSSLNTLWLPAENVFLGLLPGEGNELVMTWPAGQQHLRLQLGKEAQGQRRFESIDLNNAGQSLYLAALSAPGVWHKETLVPTYLEKDVKINWKRPFPAEWKTQLYEGDVRATYAFHESKGTIWRGVPGSYQYPVWFNGDNAYYHLSKKVPPKGESLIYFLEGHNTPLNVITPVDLMKATLGRTACESILDLAGRKLRTHHRRGGEGVHRACTCGCTEAIQSYFEVGEEVAKKADIAGALDDMVFFVRRHVARIDEYRHFADGLLQFLQSQKTDSPALKSYLENLEQIAQQIPDAYNVQKENMKSLGYADELTERTMALTAKQSTNNLNAYMDLLKAWRAMGGAQDYVVAQCHTITRALCQEAGYGCVDQSQAAELAKSIRARCRQCLRNPDGYEIWANY